MNNRYIFLALASFCLLACRAPRHVYAPALPDQAFLEQKGDSKVAAYYAGGISSTGASRSVNGFEFQAAYAVTDHWAVLLGHGNRSERDYYSKASGYDDYYFVETDVRYKRKMTDLGIGYFTPVGRSRAVYAGINGGMGFGNMTMRETGMNLDSVDFNRNYKSQLNRFFFTPFLSWHASSSFKLSLSGRVTFARFKEEQNDYTQSEIDYLQLAAIRNSTQSFFEPAIQAQFTIPNAPFLRIETGFQFCSDKSYALQSRNVTGFLGLSFDFGKIGSVSHNRDR